MTTRDDRLCGAFDLITTLVGYTVATLQTVAATHLNNNNSAYDYSVPYLQPLKQCCTKYEQVHLQ